MALNATLLPEFDHEMANTRKTLERITQDKLGWKPHEKSFSMGDLAMHLVNVSTWIPLMIQQDSFDMAPPGAPPFERPRANSPKEILELFDKNVAAARTVLAGVSDKQLRKTWTLLRGGKTVLSLPRTALIRSFVMNHAIHHRAQLCVYLRLNNLPVPAIYGPSADENPF
jgi:uncharacterized damage-inducible protein DinB